MYRNRETLPQIVAMDSVLVVGTYVTVSSHIHIRSLYADLVHTLEFHELLKLIIPSFHLHSMNIWLLTPFLDKQSHEKVLTFSLEIDQKLHYLGSIGTLGKQATEEKSTPKTSYGNICHSMSLI